MQYMAKEHDALFSKVSMPHKSKDGLLTMKQDEMYEPLSPQAHSTPRGLNAKFLDNHLQILQVVNN